MTLEEYVRLFHKHELNLVAFKRLMDCDQDVLRLVNAAIEAEREECAKVAETIQEFGLNVATAIRERGQA